MPRKNNFWLSFIVILTLSILLLVLGRSGVFSGPASLISNVTAPIGHVFSGILQGKETPQEAENKDLVSKIVNQNRLVSENQALRDQFETTYPKSQHLLPASVVFSPGFVPGISTPEYMVIDRGKNDNVMVGSAVVFKDNLVGRVTEVSTSFSRVILISNPSSNFAAKTISIKDPQSTSALGIATGLGGIELVLDNVLLSEKLSVGDYVATKGDFQINSTGYPPSLIVGKITSVEKKASDLFQRAKVKSLLDFSKLNMVFVVVGDK